MASEESSNPLAESGVTMRSDSEQYSAGEDLSTSPPSSSSPLILYRPPTIWSLIRGAAINLLLPFVNGMMLGFGELFAHEAAFRLGWGGTKVFPLSRRRAHPIGPGVEVRERRDSLRPSLNDLIGSRKFSSAGGNGSRLSVLQRPSAGARAAAGLLPMRARRAALVSPLMLGGAVATSRAFSLWGLFGKEQAKEAMPEPAASPADVAPKAVESAAAPTAAPDAAPDAVVAPSPAAAPSTLPDDVDAAAVADLVNDADILNMPEGLGYLKAMGLEFGWGPTSMMQWTLEHVHIWTGLGWGASIVATTLVIRALAFYPQVKSMQFSSGMAKVQQDPQFQEGKKLYSQGYVNRDQATLQKGSYLMQQVQKSYGVSKLGMVWGFLPIPFTFGIFRCLSNMVAIPIPSMETGGYLWFTDLTIKDPYFLLPVAATSLMFLSIMITNRHGTAQQKSMIKKFGIPIGAFGLVMSSFFSAAFNLCGVATAGFAIISSTILNIPAVRRKFNLPIVSKDTPPPAATAMQPAVAYQAPRGSTTPSPSSSSPSPSATAEAPGLRQRFTDSLNEMKKGVTDKIESSAGSLGSSRADQADRQRKDTHKKMEQTWAQRERDAFDRKHKRR